MEIQQIGTGRYRLGEGPLWDPEEEALYWVDVEGKKVWKHHPGSGALESRDLPDKVSAIALREQGGAILTLSDGFHTFDFGAGKLERIGEPIEAEMPTRFNDGKVDRRGRFVAGTMHNPLTEPRGSLYQLDVDHRVSRLDQGIICSNGPCWSLDGRTLYFTDTIKGNIFAYDYDPDSGAATNRRVLANLAALGISGVPDGCTVDSEDFLWSAQCMAGKIARIAPDGSLDRTIEMPVKYVTSVTFGGKNLSTLYVTSLNLPLRNVPPTEPNAGGLFAVQGLGFKGVPEPRFRG